MKAQTVPNKDVQREIADLGEVGVASLLRPCSGLGASQTPRRRLRSWFSVQWPFELTTGLAALQRGLCGSWPADPWNLLAAATADGRACCKHEWTPMLRELGEGMATVSRPSPVC